MAINLSFLSLPIIISWPLCLLPFSWQSFANHSDLCLQWKKAGHSKKTRKLASNDFISLLCKYLQKIWQNFSMKKEFGKWLLDVAKYITTAVILSSMIGDIKEKDCLYAIALLLVAVSLGWGLYLVSDKQKKEK